MKKILLACMMALGIGASAQISYSYGWEPTGLGSWTTTGSGVFSRTTTTPCAGSGSIRANNYYNAISYLVSPVLTGTNGGDLTVNFSYKVTQFSANATGASLADLGTIKVQWATSATGTFTTGYTINNTNHTVSGSCATKTAVLTGLPASGDIFLRFEVQSALSTTDNYVYFDDVSISQGVAPTCFSPSSLSAANITTSGALISWAAPTAVPANGYDLYYNTTNTAPTGTTTPNFTAISGTSQALSSLSPNTPYYVWVRSNCTAADKSSWIPLTFTTLATPPANDNCAAAALLTVNTDLNCSNVTAGTTAGATASAETAPSCGAAGTNDDVWFKFTATNAAHRISLTGVSGSTDMAMAVYSGACGSLVQVSCSDPDVLNIAGLTVGQEYKVRVWTLTATAATSASFNICVGTLPPPPANDVCTGAIALTVGNTFATNALITSNENAITDGTTTCQTSRGDNVWFAVVVPPGGSFSVETKGVTGSGLLDTVLSAHTGTCGNLTSIACNDDNSAGVYSTLSLSGQTPGSTIYFSVWRYTGSTGGTSTNGQFQISAYDPSVLSTNEVKQLSDKVTVYPNPFTDVLTISDVKNVKSIMITDMAGKTVKTIQKAESKLYLSDLTTGVYLVILNMNDGSKQTIKAIKK